MGERNSNAAEVLVKWRAFLKESGGSASSSWGKKQARGPHIDPLLDLGGGWEIVGLLAKKGY